jgi:hypothetical protein
MADMWKHRNLEKAEVVTLQGHDPSPLFRVFPLLGCNPALSPRNAWDDEEDEVADDDEEEDEDFLPGDEDESDDFDDEEEDDEDEDDDEEV